MEEGWNGNLEWYINFHEMYNPLQTIIIIVVAAINNIL